MIALSTNAKMMELSGHNKMDFSVRTEYRKIKGEHDVALSTKNAKRAEYTKSQEDVEKAKEVLGSISILSPIKKYRAYMNLQQKKLKCRNKKREYDQAKGDLKAKQYELRAIKKEISAQHKAMKQHEKMERRYKKMQSKGVPMDLSDVIAFNTANSQFHSQTYSINPNNNQRTMVAPPNVILYSNINNMYRQYVKEELKDRANGIKRNIEKNVSLGVNRVKQIGKNMIEGNKTQEAYEI